jgi:excisionase family DNA binding protein
MASNLLNVRQFAEELGVTVSAVRRWILERKVASVKIGRLVKLQRSEVARLIESGFRPAKQPTRKVSR